MDDAFEQELDNDFGRVTCDSCGAEYNRWDECNECPECGHSTWED